MTTRLLSILLLFLTVSTTHASKPFPIRIGVVAFGTLQWELTIIQQYALDQSANLHLNLITLANPQAGKIALHAGKVDIGVADWFWIANQRTTNNSSLTFAPYSATAGALVVPATSSISNIQQLAGKRIGIAGGEIDKNWLLLQTVASKHQAINLDASANKVFGAPPILNQQLLQGRLDALLTYWHYAARLEAKGYKRLLDGAQLLRMLGVEEQLPTLGYVFNQNWANQHRESLLSFLEISSKAKNLICSSEPAWKTIQPLLRTEDLTTRTIIRQRYCEGRIQHWGNNEQKAAAKIYSLIAKYHPKLFPGKSSVLARGTFWNYSLSQPKNTQPMAVIDN